MLIERIGKAAMLERTAEKCVECADACLKLAYHIRGEDKTHKDSDELFDNLHEEIADVETCFEELVNAEFGIVDAYGLYCWMEKKRERMLKRLANEDNISKVVTENDECEFYGTIVPSKDDFSKYMNKPVRPKEVEE